VTTASAQISGLLNTPYYWRVTSNSYGTSPYSATWNFSTVGASIFTPTLASPRRISPESRPPDAGLERFERCDRITFRFQQARHSTLVYDNAIAHDDVAALSGLAVARPVLACSASISPFEQLFGRGFTTLAPVTFRRCRCLPPGERSTGQPTTLTLAECPSSASARHRLV
jgi:hypothetical protein